MLKQVNYTYYNTTREITQITAPQGNYTNYSTTREITQITASQGKLHKLQHQTLSLGQNKHGMHRKGHNLQ